jgi:hypothetical protein
MGEPELKKKEVNVVSSQQEFEKEKSVCACWGEKLNKTKLIDEIMFFND